MKKKKRRLTYDELDDLLFGWKLMEQAEDEEERKRIREQMNQIKRGDDHDNA